MYYRYDVQEVSQFVRNFSATLFLCNVSRNHSGRYECAVIRSRGDRNPIAVWSTQIRTQLTNAEPQYTATEQSESIIIRDYNNYYAPLQAKPPPMQRYL